MPEQSSGDSTGAPQPRVPRYGEPEIEYYTRDGMEEDQERLKVVRPKTVVRPTLDSTEPVEQTIDEVLADFPAGNAWTVACALADEFNADLEVK